MKSGEHIMISCSNQKKLMLAYVQWTCHRYSTADLYYLRSIKQVSPHDFYNLLFCELATGVYWIVWGPRVHVTDNKSYNTLDSNGLKWAGEFLSCAYKFTLEPLNLPWSPLDCSFVKGLAIDAAPGLSKRLRTQLDRLFLTWGQQLHNARRIQYGGESTNWNGWWDISCPVPTNRAVTPAANQYGVTINGLNGWKSSPVIDHVSTEQASALASGFSWKYTSGRGNWQDNHFLWFHELHKNMLQVTSLTLIRSPRL